MKIKKMDMRNGEVTLVPETLDDLWHLEKVLEHGDGVRALTFRKTAVNRSGEISEGEKRPVMLTVKAEKITLQSGTMRVHGPITAGPDSVRLSSYHTIEIAPGDQLAVIKRWKKHQLDRVKKAQVKKPLLFVCVLDRDQADFAVLRESGIEPAGAVRPKKRAEQEDDRTEYYGDVMKVLESKSEFQSIIVAGPGFERENLLRFLKKESPEMAKRIIIEHSSSTGMAGVREVIKSSANRVLSDTRVARESGFVEELKKRIKTEGLVAYGPEETGKAVEMGAVETLMVSFSKVRAFEVLMEKAEKSGASVVVISEDHELGEQFLGLGGIGALLRFRTAY